MSTGCDMRKWQKGYQNNMTKETKDLICGVDKKVIRKAYFNKKLNQLFNKIQADGEYNEDETKKLGNFLRGLKGDEEKFVDKVIETFGGKLVENERPPSVQELQGKVVDLSKFWKDKQEKADAWVDKNFEIIKEHQSGNKKVNSSFWLDLATGVIMVQNVLDKVRVYFDQQYRAVMTNIIDECGTSRKEAEERARLTPQYADYKNSLLQRERLEELIMLCKKYEARGNYN